MKVMLLQAEPAGDTQDFNFPMGYAALDSVLTNNGHEVDILLTVAYHLTDEMISKKIENSDAELFGIGGMWPYLPRITTMVEMIKRLKPNAKVVIGGWITTYLPEVVLEKTGADFCICGEGEVALLKLVNCLDSGADYSGIQGLVYKQEERLINNGLGELMPLEDIPMPNWDKFPMEYYMRTGAWYFKSFATGYDRVVSWSVSRGCPYKCNFCTPGHPRYKKVDQVIKELKEIIDKFHPTFIYWMDNLVMASKSYCKQLCEALIRENIKIPYFMTGRVNIPDEELIALLKESGCACILYGLESANNELLEFMDKKTTIDQFNHVVEITKNAGIGVNISSMFGQPGETLEDFAKTLEVVLTASDPKMPYSNNQGIFPLTTFPGSPIYSWAQDNGYFKDAEEFHDKFFKDRWINFTEYPRWVVEKALAFANSLNSWNYHNNQAKYIENQMFEMMRLPQETSIDYSKVKKVAIFGTYKLGEKCYEEMKENNIEVVYFIDNSAQAGQICMGLPVYKVEYVNKEGFNQIDGVLLTSVVRKEQMRAQLMKIGFKKAIIDYYEDFEDDTHNFKNYAKLNKFMMGLMKEVIK